MPEAQCNGATVQIPLRASGQTEVSFVDGDPLQWQGDGLVYGLHSDAVSGEDAVLSAALPAKLWPCTGQGPAWC